MVCPPSGICVFGISAFYLYTTNFVNNEMNASWQLRCDPGEIYEHKAERRAAVVDLHTYANNLTYLELRNWEIVQI